MERTGNSPLEERRCQMSLTQTELGVKTGVNQSLISMIEKGHNSLTYQTGKKLSTFLDVPATRLVLEALCWNVTNHVASFETCQDFAEAIGKTLDPLSEADQITGLELASSVQNGQVLMGNTVAGQIITESVRCAPSILLSPEETKQQLAANAELGAKSQARRAEEGAGYIKAPAILGRDKEPSEIQGKLEKRPGVVIPDSGLITSQQNVQQIEAAPSILLAKPKKRGKGK